MAYIELLRPPAIMAEADRGLPPHDLHVTVGTSKYSILLPLGTRPCLQMVSGHCIVNGGFRTIDKISMRFFRPQF